MNGGADTCAVCGGPRDARGAEVPDDEGAGRWVHLSCLGSPPGVAWRERQGEADPGFARHLRLSSVGLPVRCPSCGTRCRLSAKARGMAAGIWPACCTRCSNITTLNGYVHRADYDRVGEAERQFLAGGRDTGWRAVVVGLAASADAKLGDACCPCGGRFSLAAEPRCPRCGATLLDSFFHYAEPDPE
jgi:hypothetical protein